jgi:hypothetical protein
MFYSKQKTFCNICGKEMFVEIASSGSFNGRFCSIECCREFKWRETLSIMGKEYSPKPDSVIK